MYWRPKEGWKNPYQQYAGMEEVAKVRIAEIYEIFEAGADAILHALNNQENYEAWLQWLLDTGAYKKEVK